MRSICSCSPSARVSRLPSALQNPTSLTHLDHLKQIEQERSPRVAPRRGVDQTRRHGHGVLAVLGHGRGELEQDDGLDEQCEAGPHELHERGGLREAVGEQLAQRPRQLEGKAALGVASLWGN